MYHNVDLYYLAQMGITPWVHKNNYESPKLENKRTSLLVVTPKLNDKEQYLLNNILSFIGLPKEHFIHLQTEEAKQTKIDAAFTLFFGLNLQTTPTMTKGEALNYLLTNPLATKKLFHKLIPLKEQLSSL
jgi:DNA polymerase III psi subunit